MSRQKGRRALANVGGPAKGGGDASEAERLVSILDTAQSDDADWMTHGFHSYPARMHPAVARGVLDVYATTGDRVLDPFCGSGTVLVEALVAGMRARGVDLNPIGVRLSAVKCQVRNAGSRVAFADLLEQLVEASKQRVRKKAPSMAPLNAKERSHYEVHVLKELAGLYELLSEVEAVHDKAALQILLTSIVVKFSKQRADTAGPDERQRKVGRFVPSEFYGRKGQELIERWAELEGQLHESWHRPKIISGDARELAKVLPPRWTAHLILTSPPYGGTYDYVQHHARRYPWLGLSTKEFERGELGARRNFSNERRGAKPSRGSKATARWDDEVTTMLGSMESVLEDNGQIALLMGDAQIEGRRVDVVPQLQRLGEPLGLRVVAWASQPRVDWHGGKPRGEHLVLLRRA